ncbi:unnamed protein product [Sphagnum troendelagicum]|uniref:Acyl-[acyl-carrier-protein] hydrolase n=1 Tax=Sphagnum troendelagicum TaxID=128251 RepID=A0ABP0U3H3_9BRYO
MIPLHRLRQGGFVEDSLMYRQIFVIRSYEVGADRTTSVQTIVSLFQEMALCHVHLLGVAGDGFGATRSMNPLGLIWVVTRMHVEVERYPCWPEVVEIDTWVVQAGRNGMRRDWVMRCYQTGEVLARATSTWCMMHPKTRRLAKFPDVVRDEINFTFINDRFAFPPPSSSCSDQNIKIGKLNNNTAQFVKSDLKASRKDVDMNQHVSNLKYIS